MQQFFYLIWWYIQIKILRRRKPLQTVLFINNECNLRCKHCCVDKDTKKIVKSYEQIREELLYSYNLGSRFVDFEGGEPTLWCDGEKTINDLISLAKEIGFFSTTVTTNAQKPFGWLKADSVWVSLDGIGDFHDAVRGEGAFEKAIKNIEEYGLLGRKGLSVNMVINCLNSDSVEDTIKFVCQNPYINSISLNFHMPYSGTEKLFIEDKTEILDRVIEMKKNGYPIMNTLSGLKELKKPQKSDYCWITNFIMPDGARYEKCQGATCGLCAVCGLGMASEMKNLYNVNLETILAGIKLRIFKNR